jgi:hypothetical protein
MRQPFAVAACALGALALSTASAVTVFNADTAPSGAHFKQGSSEPVCSVNQTTRTVSCTGTEISGIGNLDAGVLLVVSYSATVTCTNRGGNLVEVKTQLTVSGGSNADTRVRNGTLTVADISLAGPSDATFLSRAVCPNGNWTKALVEGSPAITGFTYTLLFNDFLQNVIALTGP